MCNYHYVWVYPDIPSFLKWLEHYHTEPALERTGMPDPGPASSRFQLQTTQWKGEFGPLAKFHLASVLERDLSISREFAHVKLSFSCGDSTYVQYLLVADLLPDQVLTHVHWLVFKAPMFVAGIPVLRW